MNPLDSPMSEHAEDWHAPDHHRIRFIDVLPIFIIHAMGFGVIYAGWNWRR